MPVPGEEDEEEPVYVNVAALTVEKLETTSDHKHCSFSQSFPPLICWLILIGILLFRIYSAFLLDKMSQLKSNQTALQDENYILISNINNLTAENENLTRNLRDVTEQLNEFKKLTKSRALLRDEIKTLTAENNDLANQKNNLETQNMNLRAEKKNLTGQIQHMEAEWIKFYASRAQWSINAYCRQQGSPTTCKPCERGWLYNQSSCYAVNNPDPAGQRSWEEARGVCRGKGSDLVVVADDNEKNYISSISWGSSGLRGHWIGLRAEDGKWKWIDGSDLANISWMTAPVTDGQCVISVQHGGWKSVSCDVKQQWFCEKTALSV